MNVHGEMRQAVEAARIDKLDDVNKAIWKAFTAGGLNEAQATELSVLLEARRTVRAAVGIEPLLHPQPEPAAVPVMPPCARRLSRVGSRPRKAESRDRRRRWEGAGYLPPALHALFTEGERAVLAVIAVEVGKRGSCTWAIGQVAAIAGVCATVVKRALRQARLAGLVSIEERRVSRRRNNTNVVRIISREWASWLRRRLPRGNHAGLGDTGGTIAAATCDRGYSKGSKPRKPGCATGRNRPLYTAAAPELAGSA